jgi:hypothetical protein
MPKADSICGIEDVKACLSELLDNRRRERLLARQNAHLWPCATLLEWITEDMARIKRTQRAVQELYDEEMRRSDRIGKVKHD